MAVYTIRTATQAVARARTLTRWQVAMCLNWVWTCLSAPKRYGVPDADAAWQRATQKEYSKNPPAGAPVYWVSGEHGHISLSVGGGRVRSTDWPVKGQISEVSIDTITRAWKMTYRGWSRDLCGDPIKGLEKPAPAPTKPAVPVLRRGSNGPWVMLLQKELLRVFPSYADRIKGNGGPNGIYGPATERVVREFEARDGRTRPDGVVDAKTLTRLRAYGVRM